MIIILKLEILLYLTTVENPKLEINYFIAYCMPSIPQNENNFLAFGHA
jgi:hypothetical protein